MLEIVGGGLVESTCSVVLQNTADFSVDTVGQRIASNETGVRNGQQYNVYSLYYYPAKHIGDGTKRIFLWMSSPVARKTDITFHKLDLGSNTRFAVTEVTAVQWRSGAHVGLVYTAARSQDTFSGRPELLRERGRPLNIQIIIIIVVIIIIIIIVVIVVIITVIIIIVVIITVIIIIIVVVVIINYDSMDYQGQRVALNETGVHNGEPYNVFYLYYFPANTVYVVENDTCEARHVVGSVTRHCNDMPNYNVVETLFETLGLFGKNGVFCEGSRGLTKEGAGYYYSYQMNSVPLTEETHGVLNGVPTYLVTNFYNVTTGIRDASIFTPPDICLKAK
nr:hypothetical protein BaRGS_024313 [Batillaria attramentaria]